MILIALFKKFLSKQFIASVEVELRNEALQGIFYLLYSQNKYYLCIKYHPNI